MLNNPEFLRRGYEDAAQVVNDLPDDVDLPLFIGRELMRTLFIMVMTRCEAPPTKFKDDLFNMLNDALPNIEKVVDLARAESAAYAARAEGETIQ